MQILILPHDFLRHFGYSATTIPPFETINHNQHYVRIASTLRGANPLGAYLIIPISLLGVLLLRRSQRTWRQAVLLAGAAVVLFFSFSRSAWFGASLSVITLLLLSRTRMSPRARKIALGTAGCVIILGASLSVAFHNNTRYENFVLHTQKHSSSPMSSNQGHTAALKNGLRDVARHPLGDGPGTAGPASIYNNHQVRISENYFIQVGQETGWLGLLLFLLINAGVGTLLYFRRADPLALSLFASLVGLTFVNLLSHAWADDTLAYVWWGLAGVALAPLPKAKTENMQEDEPET